MRAFSQVRQAGGGPELLEEARDVVTALPAVCWTFDAELADQAAARSIAWHVDKA